MKISIVACLALTIVGLIAPSAHSEEPEQLGRPEAVSVPVASTNADREKSIASQVDSTIVHLDDQNRLVGLSN
jgi:hypothetical protein